jgi:hypothetical protein
MKLSSFQKNSSGEDRNQRWRDMPATPDEGDAQPRLHFHPIPTRLQLFNDWKTCIDQTIATMLLGQSKTPDESTGLLELFSKNFLNPMLVNLDKLSSRLSQKYVDDWDGITDDEKNPVKFTLKKFLVEVLPTMQEWMIGTTMGLTLENEKQQAAEKKI